VTIDRDEVLMAREVADKFPLLDALLRDTEASDHAHEEIIDAIALFVLEASCASGEVPDDPALVRCLEAWRGRVLRETASEPTLDFAGRLKRYLELRPPNAKLLARIADHLERKQAKGEDEDRARTRRLLGASLHLAPLGDVPGAGSSLLALRAQHSKNDHDSE
jgi:hypothetical protein